MSRCWKCGKDIHDGIIICDECMDKISSFDPMTCTIEELIRHWMQYTQSEPIWNEVRDAIYQQGRDDFSKSEEYAKAINEAYNKGVEIGKRELMRDAMVIKAKADVIKKFIEWLDNNYDFGASIRTDIVNELYYLKEQK